eukprot:2287399-Prymnesium_polylepis.1
MTLATSRHSQRREVSHRHRNEPTVVASTTARVARVHAPPGSPRCRNTWRPSSRATSHRGLRTRRAPAIKTARKGAAASNRS